MKSVFICVAFLYANVLVAQYKPQEKGSTIVFNVKHFGINTKGSFTGLKGEIKFDDKSPADSKFDVSVDANSIQTGIDLRDDHLRGESYFFVANYPRIQFVSTKVEPSSGAKGMLMIYGKLTIKNHAVDISFPFTSEATNDGFIFEGSFNISRKDFEVGGSGVISDNVEVILRVYATK